MTANYLCLTKGGAPLAAATWAPMPTERKGADLYLVRDPDIAGDDSGNSVGTQVYDHGSGICERLGMYFHDVQDGPGRGVEYAPKPAPVWPLPTNIAVSLIPGPASGPADALGRSPRPYGDPINYTQAGQNGAKVVSWSAVPGASGYEVDYSEDGVGPVGTVYVAAPGTTATFAPYESGTAVRAIKIGAGGTGTLRQLISGDEGPNRKVAAIIDLIRATTAAQRTTIANNYAASEAAFYWAAAANLHPATGGYGPYTPAQRRFHQRVGFNMSLACQAVAWGPGTTVNAVSHSLGQAVAWGIHAVTALEHGLVGGAFTTSDYQTMTEPLDVVLSMPTGY